MRQLERLSEKDIALARQADRELQIFKARAVWLFYNQQKLSTIGISTQVLSVQASGMMEAFVTIKRNATDVLRAAKAIENSASVTRLAYKKDTFVKDVLEVCLRSLFDRHVCYQVTRILHQLGRGHGIKGAEIINMVLRVRRITDQPWPDEQRSDEQRSDE